MKARAAFLAGLVLGAAGAWFVATRGLGPAARAPVTGPSAAPPSASAGGVWTAPPEAETPLGTPASSIPGDSTDGQLTPKALAAPADAPAVPSVGDIDRLRTRCLLYTSPSPRD